MGPHAVGYSEIRWNIIQCLKELGGPLAEVCEAAEASGHRINGERLAFDALLWTVVFCAQIDGRVAQQEIDVAASVLGQIFQGMRSLGYPTQAVIRGWVVDAMGKPAATELSHEPLKLLAYLRDYDAVRGTTTRNIAVTMMFRLANAICKADGLVTEDEHQALLRFKSMLFDDAGREPIRLKAGAEKSTAASTPVVKEQNIHALDKEKEIESTPIQVAASQPNHVDALLAELNALIGLETVKREVTELVSFLKIQALRKSKGLASPVVSRHLVFLGRPGTGKTTVARLIAQLYSALGVLSKGHVIETDRSGLVAGYVGQTALKVKELADRAAGGVLFIDEAYSLVASSGQDSYGQEAIDILLKLMEDRRDDFVVIVAGYTDKMHAFLNANPGLASRFNRRIIFDDYSPDRLVEIFTRFCQQSSYQVDDLARSQLAGVFASLYEGRQDNFGNARLARNIFEVSINKQATRLAASSDISIDSLTAITRADIPQLDDLTFP